MEEILNIYCDGGSRGNPGESAAAFVVKERGGVVHSEAKYLGIATNNFAEYSAVLLALQWIIENKLDNKYKNLLAKEIAFILDSELVVRQINGVYKVKNNNLMEIYIEVKKILGRLPNKIIFKNVTREKNIMADSLVNKVLDNLL